MPLAKHPVTKPWDGRKMRGLPPNFLDGSEKKTLQEEQRKCLNTKKPERRDNKGKKMNEGWRQDRKCSRSGDMSCGLAEARPKETVGTAAPPGSWGEK